MPLQNPPRPGGFLRGPQKYAFEGGALQVGRASTAGERELTCGRAPLQRTLTAIIISYLIVKINKNIAEMKKLVVQYYG